MRSKCSAALRAIAAGSVIDPDGSTSENGQITLRNLRIDRLVFNEEHVATEIRFARLQYGRDIRHGRRRPGSNRQRLIQGLAPDRLENDGFGPHAMLEMFGL